MNPARIIRTLRRDIPSFYSDCIPGCSDCCGCVVASRWELDQMGGKFINYDDPANGGTFIDYRINKGMSTDDVLIMPGFVEKFHEVYTDNASCQFFSKENGCLVYNRRPLICRLYGTIEGLYRCPHGCGPKKMIPFREGMMKLKEYIESVLIKGR